MRKILFGFLLLCLLALVGVRFAEPVSDADLFWQMAYGRYMVEHMTLVPDHTIYSWTPSTNATIYCAWVAEIVFYGLYSMAGLPLLFAFRYACILLTLWLLFEYARRVDAREPRLRVGARPELYLYAVVMLLGGYVGTLLKPEIFSLVAFHVLAWGYFAMKLQARDNLEPSPRWLWFFPILMLVWVNSHGVFMFGLAALLVLCAGEWVNRQLSPGLALPDAYLKRFSYATLLSVAACFVTPYGFRYPLQLVQELQGMLAGTQAAGDAAAYASLGAHQSIFQLGSFHFVPLMIFMVLALLWYWILQAGLRPAGQRVDFAVVAVNVSMGLLFLWYARTTYYWPPFWAYSCLYGLLLVGQAGDRALDVLRPRLIPGLLSALAFVAICAGSAWQSVHYPYASSWCGFGITYWNPVVETEWLERFEPQARIYNDYDGGGYLLWKLYPQTKVMIDPRSFPYRDWYAEYSRFEQGQIYHEFLDQFEKCDVAVISLKNVGLWRRFAASGEWVVAWIGPSSAIWVRPGKQYPAAANDFAPRRFREIRSFVRCLDAYSFCIELGFYDQAFEIVKGMATNFGSTPEERQVIAAFTKYKEALEAEKGELNLDKALLLYEECRRMGIFFSDAKLMELYKIKVKQLSENNVNNKNTQEIRDLAVRMSAVARGEAPPLPSKELHGPPLTPTP